MHRSTLAPDLAYWDQKARHHHGLLEVSDIVSQAEKLLWSPYVALMVIRHGVPSVYMAWTVEDFALKRMVRMRRSLEELHANGFLVPDTMFLFNSEDIPICHRVDGCKASHAC